MKQGIANFVNTWGFVCLLLSMSFQASADCPGFSIISANVTEVICKGESNGSIIVTVNPAGSTNFEASIVGGPGPITLPQATLTGGQTVYRDTFPGLSAGVYDLVVKDETDCYDTVTVTVREPAQPFVLDFDTIVDASCGDNGKLAVFTTGGWSQPTVFTWSAFDQSMNLLPGYPRTVGYQLTSLGGGSYTVEATDLRGCKATASTTLTANDTFTVYLVPNTDQTINLGDSLILSASVSSGTDIQYTWFPRKFLEVLTPTGDSVQVTPCSPVTYIVLAIDETRECADADSVSILLTGFFDPFIPNIFNPNSRNPKNNVFQVFGIGLERVEMEIYDRKGALMYKSPDDVIIGTWDGTFDGKEAVAGKYIYVLRVTSVCGDVVNRTGGVTLLR